jgi:hypothetical protein
MVALNKFTRVARRDAYGSLCLGAWAERGPFPFPATGTILVRGSILPLHGRREDRGLELAGGEEVS